MLVVARVPGGCAQEVVDQLGRGGIVQPWPVTGLRQTLDPGARLYPTGNKDGLMWEVKDDKGNLGWVSSITFDLAR